MFPLNDPVCVLLEKPFSKWNKDDQKDFLNSEKPTPALNIKTVTKIKDKVYSRHFKQSWYADFEWLCGSCYLNKLFCLPCLVLSDSWNVWNRNGFNDFCNVVRALHKHESSSEHIRCALSVSKLKKRLNSTDDVKEGVRLLTKHSNENVHLNRRFMQLPIRAVIYLAERELFSARLEESSNNFKTLLDEFISVSPLDIRHHYKKISQVFADNLCAFQTDIIDCISGYVDDFIVKEVKTCAFFSIEVIDSTEPAQKPQCVVVMKYVIPSGKFIERFLGFYDMPNPPMVKTIYCVISKCLEKFDYHKTKLVGVYFDGSSVITGQLRNLHVKIKESSPQAVLVHRMSYSLNLVLQQCCNVIDKCRIFFATINGLNAFFDCITKRTYSFESVIRKLLLISNMSNWSPDCNVICFVNTEWVSLKKLFTEVINTPSSDQEMIRQSELFSRLFYDFQFTFFVVVFNYIFELTDAFYAELQTRSFDIGFCVAKIKNTITSLHSKRNNSTYMEVFNLVLSKTNLPTEHCGSVKNVPLQIYEKYRLIYYAILDLLITQITIRFQDVEKLHFVTLMDTSKFAEYSVTFPAEIFDQIKFYYSKLFNDLPRLKNELRFIYENEQYRGMDRRTLLRVLAETGNIFKEAFRLFSLIVTVTSNGDSEEQLVINKRLCNTLVGEKITKISVNKALLKYLISSRPFYDDIIDMYGSAKDRCIDLKYSTNNDLPHKCQKCGRGFSKQEYLGKHQKTNCESKTEVLECKPDLPIREITYEQNANWDSSAATTSKSVPYHRTISPTKTDPLATHHEIPKTVIKEEVDADDFDDTYSSQSGDGEQMEYVNCLSDQGELEDPLSEKQHGREGQFTSTAHSQSFPSVLEVADSLAQDIENILNDDLFKFGAVNPIKPRVQPPPIPGMKQEPTLTELKSKCALVELKLRMHYLKTLIQNEEEIGSLKKEACKLQITKEQLEINNMRESHLQKMENLKLEQEFWKLQLKNKIK